METRKNVVSGSLCFGFLLLCLLFLRSARGATLTWTNTSGGDWNVAANWSPNQVPASGDNVIITENGTYTVTNNSGATVGSLTLGGASGVQTLTISSLTPTNVCTVNSGAVLNWGEGNINGSLTVASGGTLNLNSGDYYIYGALTNNGTVNWSAGNIYGNGPPSYPQSIIYNVGVWNAQSDGGIYVNSSGTPVFINTGTLEKTGGTGTTTINWNFTSTGTILPSSGQFSISTWTGDSTLQGNYTGNLTMPTGASLTVVSNAVFNWNGGTINGALTVTSGGVLNLTNDAGYYIYGALTNNGTVNWSAGNIYGNGPPSYPQSIIYNVGVWNAQSDGGIYVNNSGTPVFINTGTLEKTGGTGTTTINWNFTSTGTILPSSGQFSISTWTGDNTLQGNYTGPINAISNTIVTVPAGTTVNWTGGIIAAGGTLNVASNAIVNWNGGTINGALTVASGGVLNLTNDAGYYIYGALTNNGTVNWSAGNIYGNGPPSYPQSIIYNVGVWNAQFDGGIYVNNSGTPVFINTGTLEKTGGTGTSDIYWNFTSTGTILTETGQFSISTWTGDSTLQGNYTGNLTMPTNASLTISNSAVLNWNSGEIDGALTVASGGVLNLTNDAGYYIYGALTNNGTVNWSAGNIYGNGPPSYPQSIIYNVGVWNAQSDGGIYVNNSGTPVFINTGTLEKTGGTGTSSFGWTFNNDGGSVSTPSGSFNMGDWTGNGFVYGNANISGTINGQLTVSSGNANISATINGQLTISSNAVANWNGGDLEGALTVNPGGTLTLSNNIYFDYAGVDTNTAALSNYGTVVWAGNIMSYATYNYGVTGSATIYNAGAWESVGDNSIGYSGTGINVFINAGTLEKTGGTSSSSISWRFNNNGGSVSTPSGSFSMGNWKGNGIIYGNANISSGTMAGIIASNAVINWNGNGAGNFGDLEGSLAVAQGGMLTLSNNIYFDYAGVDTNTAALTNYGTVVWAGNITSYATYNYGVTGSATIYNAGAWESVGDNSIGYSGTGINVFINAGTLEKTGGTSSSSIYWRFNNNGGSVSTPSGSFSMGNWKGNGIIHGNANFSSGTMAGIIASNTVINWNGYGVGNFGDLEGALTVNPGGMLTLSNNIYFDYAGVDTNTAALTNYGTVVWVGNITSYATYNYGVTGSATIYNAGAWESVGDNSIGYNGTGINVFINTGTLEKAGGTSTSSIYWNSDNGGGTVFPLTGTVAFNGGLNFTNGLLKFAMSGPSSYGKVSVSGTANLAGGVGAVLLNGYVPAIGTQFNVMSFGSSTGDFTNYSGLNAGGGIGFTATLSATAFTLQAAATNYSGTVPYIITQPSGETVNYNSTATLSVAATGSAPLMFQWYRNDVPVPGGTNATLTFPNVLVSQSGTYTVSITNSAGGVVSQPVQLTVNPAVPVLTWSSPAPINYGKALSAVQLDASANTPGTFVYNPPAGTVLNAGGYTLSVAFTPTDSVDYTNASANTSLSVSQIPLIVTANNASRAYDETNPVFSGTITGLTNGDNITATYSCSAVPISPPGSYPIVPSLVDPNNRAGNYAITYNNGTLTVSPGPPPALTNVVPNVGLTNGGTPVVLLGSGFELGAGVAFGSRPVTSLTVNSNGTQISALTPVGPLGQVDVVVTNPDTTTVTLTNGFTFKGPPPAIVTEPVSLTVAQGSNAVFQVGALYAGAYQWQMNGGNLTDNGRISGSTSSTLTIADAQYADSGNYQVFITNDYGSTNSVVVTLNVVVPPTITSAPQSESIGTGGTAMFTVGVSGSAPFSYQWLKGGSPVSGATSQTLTLANVQTSDAGQYSVEVSNFAGAVTSAPPATLTVLDYCASAQPGQAVYPMGSPVPLTVRTYDCGTGTPVPNANATVWISTGGITRSLSTTTDGSGFATVNFVPLPTEAGTYRVAAALAGQSIPAVQSTFTLAGMGLSTNGFAIVLTPGVPVTNMITMTNLSSVDLTGITAGIAGSAPDVQVRISAPGTLAGNATNAMTVVMTAPANQATQDVFNLQLTTAQGTTNEVPVVAMVVPASPQLAVSPSPVTATMAQGGQTLVNFNVENVGGQTSGAIQIGLPSAPWLSLVTPQPIPPLAPGQSSQVTLALTPATNLTLGAYPGNLVLTSPNANLTVPFTFNCVSTLTGDLQVTVQDELSSFGAGSPNVSNATVTVSDFQTGTNVASAVTGASGTVLFTNLTSAYYTVDVSAPNHKSFSQTMLVKPNQTNDLTAFINLQLVDYTWEVMPTTVPDHYEFKLVTTFQTKVPWPVVTVNPGAIDLCSVQGASTQVNLTITNSGLVAAQNLNLYFGNHPDWLIQPLVTKLGDLGPESSMVVPVTITRLASTTGVPDNIAAQLSYQVITPTQNWAKIVPIYIYDANPSDCNALSPTQPPAPVVCTTCAEATEVGTNGASIGSVNGNSGGGGGGGGFASPSISSPSYSIQTPQGALVQAKLEIDQSAVIARDAFHATLKLDNNAGAAISNLSVNITVYDTNGNVATSLFGIPAPQLNGLNAVDGTGVLNNGTSGTATWTIVPATNAAPQVPTEFRVGGSFSYIYNGEPVTVPLFPTPITVNPTPIFIVDYFLQHDVYGDDPFTPQIEPSIPFDLGILVRNVGYGSAHDFSITSAQPKIIQNSNDLLIAFSIIGSQIGASPSVSPSLTLDFGNLGPQSNAVGLWKMTSTLEGQFIGFDASFQHVDDFGNTNTSLISSVNIHELNHVVRLTTPIDDGLPDFLVNDTSNVDALPDIVYSSDGSTYPVTSVTSGTTTGTPSASNSNVTFTVSAPPGWAYFEVVDPGAGNYPIVSVKRSDGENLLVGPNVWQTPARPNMVPPKPNNLIHIFDYNSTGSYTITYGLPPVLPSATTLAAINVTPTNAALQSLVNPGNATTEVYFEGGTTTNYSFRTQSTVLSSGLSSAQSVSLAVEGLQQLTMYHFRVVAVNSVGTNYGDDLTFATPSLPLPAITQVAEQSAVVGQVLTITNVAEGSTPPVTFSLDAFDPVGATITTNGVFTWSPTCGQGSSSNLITIWATDSSIPALSNAMTFVVTVGECVHVGIGSTIMQVGQTSSVPVTLLSSVSITNLNWTLVATSNRIGNLSFTPTDSSIATSVVQVLDGSRTAFNLITKSNQTLQSPSQLGNIVFTALPGHSAFVPLVPANILAEKSDGTFAGNIAGQPGRAVIINIAPLIEAGRNTNLIPTMTLYGNPGSNYEFLTNSDLGTSNWPVEGVVTMTNLFENFPLEPTAPRLFYRARTQ